MLERDHFEIHVAGHAVIFDAQIFFPDGTLILARLVDGLAQRDQQAFARQLQQIARRLVGRLIEIGRGVAAQLQDVHLLVDERARRGVAREDDPVGFALRLRLAARGGTLRARHRRPPDCYLFSRV